MPQAVVLRLKLSDFLVGLCLHGLELLAHFQLPHHLLALDRRRNFRLSIRAAELALRGPVLLSLAVSFHESSLQLCIHRHKFFISKEQMSSGKHVFLPGRSELALQLGFRV